MSEIRYPDVSQISHTTKEAVAASILHQTYDRLRGAGEYGRVIYREKPSKVLHTQNLLPRRKASETASTYLEKDDVTTPVHIGTAGMTFQIVDSRDRSLSVAIHCCVYVRVLPTVADLNANPVVFRLAADARSTILRHRRMALRQLESENAGFLETEDRTGARWTALREAAIAQAEQAALHELGVSRADLNASGAREVYSSTLAEGDEAPPADDPSTDIEAESDENEAPATDAGIAPDAPAVDREGNRDSDALKSYEFVVKPGTLNAPPPRLIQPEQIPQKWVRIPVDLGRLTIDLSKSQDEIDASIADFNEAMRRRIEEAINTWESDADLELGGRLWAFPAGHGKISRLLRPAEVVDWEATLEAIRRTRQVARPTILPVLEYENLDDPLHANERTIRIIVANESDLIDPREAAAKETDASIYQFEMSVAFDPDLHKPITLDRIEPSYRYNRFLTHDALGINCGVRRRRLSEARVLETTSLPIYFQPLIEQFEIAPAPEFERMGAADGGIPVIRSLLAAYDAWLASVEAARPYESALDPVADQESLARERRQFEEVDLPSWRNERRAMARGLALLEKAHAAQLAGKAYDSPEVIPLTAWRLMNQTFGHFWSIKSRRVKSWRLFQIAFALSQIPPIISRLAPYASDSDAVQDGDETQATLLYFSTGGGKSESFFGLLVFSLFFDRLRGKTRGVTSIIRYPLRLLTSQQAFRLSQVLASAEATRWSWGDRGERIEGSDFDIGFWVGGNNTPNNQTARGVDQLPKLGNDWDELGKRRGDYSIYLKKWSRLPSCPFCRGSLETANGKRVSTIGLRRVDVGRNDIRLAHLCFNQNCSWNRRHNSTRAPHPLPMHIMDSDIYAYAPSVLLGTVDKAALIGQSARTIARVLGIFGFPAWYHTASRRFVSPYTRDEFRKGPNSFGCEPVFPFYRDGRKLLFDPYPLLEIQDEAHLLDESLGTFSGLFETTFYHALRTLAPLLEDQAVSGPNGWRAARIVAASATVTEPERQIDQIYQRSVVLFPQPGPDLYESFYARLKAPDTSDVGRQAIENVEHKAPTRRRYVSLMTNGRTHTAATVAVLSAFHLTITSLLKTLIEGDEAARMQIRAQMADAIPDDVFQDWHRRVLLDPSVSHADIAAIISLDRIALLYVTNKKGGDNVKAALQDVVRRDHRLAGFEDIPGVKTQLITGAIDAGLIGAIVSEAAIQPPTGSAFSMADIRDSLRSVIATSAISHGVDVDEFNMMFFAGQPADIAEYIQASSRVGRTHVGTSILIPTPQQRRDRYIVEIHDIFHRFLERMIHAAPVERWAENAITRTLASFLQLKVCGVDYIQSMNSARTPNEKAEFAEPDNVGEIGNRSAVSHIAMLSDLRTFVTDGIGLYHATSPINKQFYVQRIEDLFDRATQAMEQANWKTEPLDRFFRQPGCPLSKPMTSLRDVNEAGQIEGGYGTGTDRIDRSNLGRVMSALMRGNNAWNSGDTGD